jgi:hypothetical protein
MLLELTSRRTAEKDRLLRSYGRRSVQGLFESRRHSRRAKDPERLSAGHGLDHQPHSSADSQPDYFFSAAFPIGIGAPTLQPVRREAEAGFAGDQATTGEAPAVSAGGSD